MDEETLANLQTIEEAVQRIRRRLTPTTPASPTMTLYSQRDPRWRGEVYAGGTTFGAAGCYVTCVAMLASFASADEPPEVARKLREAGCFSGALLVHPERIPTVYPDLAWLGSWDWRRCAANLDELARVLEDSPTIIEIEFRPGGATPPEDQHFVVALRLVDDDLWIADPWDGAETRLLERYALDHWDLARAIYGMRRLEVAHGR